MCARLIDDQIFIFSATGPKLNATANELTFSEPPKDGDEIELQVLHAAADGVVRLYQGATTTANDAKLRLELSALAAGIVGPGARVRALGNQPLTLWSTVAGRCVAIARLYRPAAGCKGC